MPTNNSRIAYGTINPMRFCMPAPGEIFGVVQATGPGTPVVGIAMESVNGPMGAYGTPAQGYPAAASGGAIMLYEPYDMQTMVIVGSGQTVLPNTLLVSDASGNAKALDLASTTAQWVGAMAVEPGVEGNPIRVIPLMFPYVKNA
jgi:hypothetical protein